jgi:hypothetical protein
MNLDETELPELMFETLCPLGYKIRTSTWHWYDIRLKHQTHNFIAEDVEKCIHNPDIIVRSTKDENVFLCYKAHIRYILVVVCKKVNDYGFLVTAYLTDKIKKGEILWQQ